MRLEEIRSGFERPFWVANITEAFERMAYYTAFASLALYLHERLNFSTTDTAGLTGLFGGLVWFMAIFGGAVADKLGFRKALGLAYLILAFAYFMLGSIGAAWLAPLRDSVPLYGLVLVILMLPALGIAMVKPSVVGTTARASKENVRSLGYSIYYTLVNVGSFFGPILAGVMTAHGTPEEAFRISAVAMLLMCIAVLFLFHEPRRAEGERPPSLGQTARNFLTVLGNPRFILFLLIFSGFWFVYWQQYISLPIYLHEQLGVSAALSEKVLITDPLLVICLQVVVSLATKRIPPFAAITLGTLIASLSWVVLAAHPALGTAIAALAVLALGEMVLSPRYYEYVSRLAPAGQQGTYMGFAFLPIGIGSLLGRFAGNIYHYFSEVRHEAALAWWCFAGVGVGAALLLWVYDLAVKPAKSAAAA